MVKRPALFAALVALSGALAASAPAQEIHVYEKDTREAEAAYYRIVTLPLPERVQCEAGQLCFLPDGKLALSSRIGDIWIGDGVLQEPPKVKWTQFARGLHEPLGLAYKDGWLYAAQRPELTRLKDTDGDGKADVFETVSDGWGINGDYHEYDFGSKFDKDGNLWILLTLTGSFGSESPFRGWALRITPDGKVIPTCSGVRSPGGIGFNAAGDVFYTDNQGPWNGGGPLRQLIPGEFEGNPAGLRWYDEPATRDLVAAAGMKKPDPPKEETRLAEEIKHNPMLHAPSVWFPYYKMGQSCAGIVCDQTGGKFGPFKDQLFVGDVTHSMVMRVFLEKVNGRYQGVCFPFRRGFDSGVLSLEFASDGSLFTYGTDRGWGATGGKPYALQRLVWTGKTPFEVSEMRAEPDGFELLFTQPVDPKSVTAPESYRLETFTYIHHSTYGSPEVDKTKPAIRSIEVAPDGRSARLRVDKVVEGHIHELHLEGVRSANGEPLLHDVAFYTLNAIPEE